MENYGLFKNHSSENYYNAFAKMLNSAYSTRETKKTIKLITKKDIVYGHMGQLVIKDGICYSTFLQNSGNDGEEHDSVTSGVVLSVFSLEEAMSEGFKPETDVEVYPIGKKGDYCAGYKAKSIFKDNSMCVVGNTLYICFSFIAEDGIARIFSKSFDINKKIWCDEAKVSMKYNDKLYDFSDETLNLIYGEKDCPQMAKGLIELVSAWNEYKGEYYATGVAIERPNNGVIVKTSDFKIMETVDVVPFNDKGTAEIASYVFKDRLFVACRQDYSIPYLYMGFMDLKTMEWKHYYKIADGNVRPWFFEYKGELYLINTIQEIHRRYTNISRVRVIDSVHEFYNNYAPVETVTTIKDCGSYFATANVDDEIYFVSTHNTGIGFGKLALKFYDPDEVNGKMLSAFEQGEADTN